MRYMKRAGPCTAPGCNDKIIARGLCNHHYRAARAGKPRKKTARNNDPISVRLERWIERDPNSGCWLWSGNAGSGGRYGQMAYRGKMHRVHRLAYEALVGPIGDGEIVCHRCDTTLCVNPDHLWLGTQSDNMRDMTLKGRGRPRGRATYSVRFTEVRA